MAGLVYSDAPDYFSGQFCGGSLVDKNWVITAAHCVHDLYGQVEPPDEIDVILGVHDLQTDIGERVNVKRIVVHPQYDDRMFYNDIALLELERSVTALSPVPMSFDPDSLADAMGIVMGWGDTTGDDNYPDVLMEATLPIVSNDTCAAVYGSRDIIDTMLCAGYPEGGKDACSGDSGGPLVVADGTGGWFLAGIVSWGNECAMAGYYGVYTRLSMYRTFIGEYIPITYPLRGVFSPLRICAGLPVEGDELIPEVGGDQRTGLEEVIFNLQIGTGVRNASQHTDGYPPASEPVLK